jgi:hypothetical protein
MSIEVRAISTDPKSASSIQLDGRKMERMLGPQEDAIAVQLNELLTAVRDAISKSVEIESDLEIEITGGITLKADGAVKYLFFNVGGSTESKDTIKVTLKTKVRPATE